VSPEELARLQEDTRHEQFFFDAPTVRRLVGRAASFDHPLLVCMPSLAVHLHAAGRPVTLLDRDRRFRSLPGFERWDLLRPHMVFGEHDAIFVDPPFANITPAQLARAVELLVGGMPRQPALFVCHLRE
jgi:16S rRNA G966 N2-methylase RsmD